MTALTQIPAERLNQVLSDFETKQSDTGHGACKFTREQIREAWGLGIINDAAYVWLAVNFMRTDGESDFTLDIGEFCDIWTYEIDAGKYKRLKPESVRKILSTWEAKGIVTTPQQPVQLKLLF